MSFTAPIQQVPLGSQGLRVSALGLGCMVMSAIYGTPDADEARATFDLALERGITFLDTANAYTGGENERLVGSLISGRRDGLVVATKFGLATGQGGLRVDSSPAHAIACCDASLMRLGVDRIDLYYAHRLSPHVPVEDTVGAMAELVAAGKVGHLGLCEVDGDTLRRAYAVHPISAVQSEWSLWARAVERTCVPMARELGVGIVPYGPLGRGFLTGAIAAPTAIARDDNRAKDPRFADQNFAANLRLVDAIRSLAVAKGVTNAQIALGWLKAQGGDVVPIPGTERRDFLDDNLGALAVRFTVEELARLDDLFPEDAVAGNADGVHLRNLT